MVLRNASLMTDMATLSNPAALAVRNLVLRLMLGLHAVQDRMAATMSETEIGYAGGPLSKGRHGGRRLDPKHYDGAPPGAGTIPRWVLYTADPKKGAAMAQRFPSLLEPASRAPGSPGELLIVRPDAYIGLSAGRDRWDEAEQYLETLAVGAA